MMRILVTDGDSRAALAVVRSLGAAGHHVIVGERRSPALAQTSRHCAARFTYPDPCRDAHRFVERILRELADRGVDVLLPVADVTTALIAERREDVERHCALPIPSREAIARAADKVDVLRTAQRLGVPIPMTAFVSTVEEALAQAAAIGYPVVVKARRSRVRTDDGWLSSSVGYAGTPEELTALVRAAHPASLPLIVQERIAGAGMGMFFCVHQGAVVASFSHRRLREKPPSGGVSVLSESLAPSPRAAAHSVALLEDLGWEGVAMVEFKIDDRDGIPRLMEINGRFWGSLQLAVDAGVDFPAILISTVTGDLARARPDYRVGVKSRWLWGDIDSMLLRTFGRGSVGAGGDGYLAELGRFLKLWEKDVYYENPRASDLRPWLYETSQWVRRLGGSR